MLATHARFLWTGGVFPCQFVVARTMCLGTCFRPLFGVLSPNWAPIHSLAPFWGSFARIGLLWPELGYFGPKWALCPKWAPWPVMGPRPEMGLPLPK